MLGGYVIRMWDRKEVYCHRHKLHSYSSRDRDIVLLLQQYITCIVLMTAKEVFLRVTHTHTKKETLSLTHRFLSNQYLPTASKVLNFSDVYMEQAITLLYKQNPFAHETRSRKQIKKMRKKRPSNINSRNYERKNSENFC